MNELFGQVLLRLVGSEGSDPLLSGGSEHRIRTARAQPWPGCLLSA